MVLNIRVHSNFERFDIIDLSLIYEVNIKKFNKNAQLWSHGKLLGAISCITVS